MRAYMGFSRSGGSHEGAVLIFANTAREAKKVAWGGTLSDICNDEFTDIGIRWLKKEGFAEADKEKLAAGIPHVIDNPTCCEGCELWGVDILDDGYCLDCHADWEERR